MFVGHLAAGLAGSSADRRVPLGAAVAAAFALDLLWPILLLLGLETVRIRPGDTAFTNLHFVSYPWSHSLATVLAWSVLAAVAGRAVYGAWRIGAVLGGLVASHWLLDFVTHRPDLPLWPGGPVAGLGLWNSIAATVVVEGSLLAAGVWLYIRARRGARRTRRGVLAALVLVTGVIWISQPWSPPPPTPTAVAWGGLVLWLLPLWAAWIERQSR